MNDVIKKFPFRIKCVHTDNVLHLESIILGIITNV